MIQGSELDFGVVLICLSKLAKNSFSLNRIPREFLFERNGSLFPFQWSGTVSLHRLTKLAVIRPLAPSDARAPFQCVPFGRFVSVTNGDWEKRKSRVELVCNEHLHKNGGGGCPIIFAPYSEYQQWAGISAKHCECLPMQVEYCGRR